MSILEIEKLSKTYKGNKKAVDQLSIQVEISKIWLLWTDSGFVDILLDTTLILKINGWVEI